MTRQEYYEKYDDHAKLDLAQKYRLERLVGKIVAVALLFADYDSTTGEDPEEVHGGDDNTRYHYELCSCADVKTAMADARTEDETERKQRKERK